MTVLQSVHTAFRPTRPNDSTSSWVVSGGRRCEQAISRTETDIQNYDTEDIFH